MEKRPTGKKNRRYRVSPWMAFLSTVLIVLTVASTIWFSASYTGLNRAIQSERVDAVTQIGEIILEKTRILSDSYASELEQAAKLLKLSEVTSLEQASAILGETSDYCILSENGSCTDLTGAPVYFLDIRAIFASLRVDTAVTHFGSVQTRGDFWIFSVPLEGVSFEGAAAAGLIKLVHSAEYAEVTTNTIFGDLGATYVVSSGGVILLRPDNAQTNAHFKSYNLLSGLRANGVAESDIAALRAALEGNGDAQIVTQLEGETWLIQSVSDASERNIVLTVPISITARETFENMRYAIAAMVLMVIELGLLCVIWIMFFLRRDGELALEQAKAGSKSDFMNKVSHDIRTPLNAIVGMIEVAERSIDDTQAVSDCLVSAKKSSEYLISIINDVLDMSRIENGKMDITVEPFDLKQLLEVVMEIELPPAKAKGTELILQDDTEGGVDHVGDDVRIKQCLVNLISNAVKFTPAGGTIRLRCEEQRHEGASLVRFYVEDNGIGMSEEFMEHLFDPFEQEKSSDVAGSGAGSGLGLSIVYNLVVLMGGSVSAESEKGAGSRFVIELPFELREKVYAEDEQLPDLSAEHLNGRRVILAEDNELNRIIAGFLLRDLGLSVTEAQNGLEAVELFEKSAQGYYDLILMDIRMPVLDGLEAARRIRESAHPQAKAIPIIALSANAFREDEEKSRAAGMQEHLSKPINPKQLKAALVKYIKV